MTAGDSADGAVAVRPAAPADATDIARLAAQLGYAIDEAAVVERLARILERADHQVLVADVSGRPVGWVHALVAESIETARAVVIGGLVVDRNHRRSGIGRTLMAQAEAWAVAQGCTAVRVRSSDGRAAAHQFYRGIGYTQVKTQFAFVKTFGADAADRLEHYVPTIAE